MMTNRPTKMSFMMQRVMTPMMLQRMTTMRRLKQTRRMKQRMMITKKTMTMVMSQTRRNRHYPLPLKANVSIWMDK
jgi:hypothetical protein